MTLRDSDIVLIFSNKMINLLSVILRRRSEQADIKRL